MPAVKVPATLEHLDLTVVAKVLVKHNCNVTKTANELHVPITDLRRLTVIHPTLIDAAFEVAEKRLDKAEEIVDEALHSDSPSARAAAAYSRLYDIDIDAQKKKIKAAGGYAHLAESVHTPE